ncbi:MAG TPA: 2,3,4,5-tetrahydropyridine-2,6-dicarboxylate N-acetyltransferase [Thermotogota bacterium]|nr:2,3,4,5-tetrahydropyridine-2,6-dicarboxylate N-acetyltransferase [Thermotogota bacterium]HPJ87888.1 2,3,4,5-tetrahydropyridine-2,6-dicarboxylate N-acetyltransferase [Thermotogota bacterium]HPR94981.1 2,3,4,5-tetrahydropyridine-2,6-dicarboxylate N-acetyltransferase [Thermotogota bacterium]
MDSYELIDFIAKSEKQTPVKVYLKGMINEEIMEKKDYFGNEDSGILFCSLEEWNELLKKNTDDIINYKLEYDRRNSAIPLADITRFNARIEPGAIIREHVSIEDGAVIMMGAVINLGAEIGKNSMIDMNVVVGGRAKVGENCHIGAGSVLAGVIEPPSADPVIIEDNVLVGANAVITEGVRVGKHSVIAAGAIVLENVPPYTVYAGVPAKKIKDVDEKTVSKTQVIQALREL